MHSRLVVCGQYDKVWQVGHDSVAAVQPGFSARRRFVVVFVRYRYHGHPV